MRIADPDGSATITRLNNTKYESDGNVCKNGQQIKKNGEWVEGYDPAKDSVEPDDIDPEETESEETEPEEEGLSAARRIFLKSAKPPERSKRVAYDRCQNNHIV